MEAAVPLDLFTLLTGAGGSSLASVVAGIFVYKKWFNGTSDRRKPKRDAEVHDKLDKMITLQTEANTYLRIMADRN
jgi:excinuclease UvrABC ATPase subunit